MLSGALFNLLVVSDRTLVSILFDAKSAGYFALSGMILQGMQVLPQSLSMIFFPQMAQCFGKYHSFEKLRPYVVKNLIFNAILLVPTSLILLILIGPLITKFLPAYIPGIEPARVACVSAILWVYLGTGSVFGVTGKMKWYLAALASSICIVWILGVALVTAGGGLMGASWARFIGTAIIATFTITYAFRFTARNQKTKLEI